MIIHQKLFILSTLFILISGIYGNIYHIAKYIFYINFGYFVLKYIVPYFNYNKIDKKEHLSIKCKVSELNKINGDNSIYLTQFKYSGFVLYLYHFVYGYYSYFFDFINLFCLTISFFQIYDYKDFRSFIPLSIFSTLYSMYYTYTISKLIAEQNSINKEIFKGKKISKIKRGDILEIDFKDKIPADILILTDDFHVATNELELTGENIVVNKRSILECCRNEDLLDSPIEINQKKNNGCIQYQNKLYNYNENNIIFRGTKMIDGRLKGIVIEVGNDCMIYNIDNQILKEKTWLYKKVNSITFDNLYYLLILASVLSGALKYVYPNHKFIILVKTIVLLLNTIVPLSLQSFYNASTWILSNKIQKEENIKINSHGTHCFQNNPKYIVTDKTGTITKNKLKLFQIINVKNTNNLLKSIDITDFPGISNFKDVMSCTLINTHSTSKDYLLKNDEIEYLLLEWCMENDIVMLNNNYNDANENLSYYKYSFNNTEKSVQKLYYKSFDYKLGIKYCITKENDEYILNIQGIPESINHYANNMVHEGEKLIRHVSDNSYRRIICYAKKNITQEEYNNFKQQLDINILLHNFPYVNIYIFEDHIVDNLAGYISNLLNDNRNITILTGDRLSSSIEVGKILNMCDDMLSIDNVNDFINANIDNYHSVLLNGRIFIDLLNDKFSVKLKQIIQKKNKIIIYRATPEVKEKYIQYIKLIDPDNQVMMIGDGSNDIAAIMKSDIGIAIVGESTQIQNISDIVIDNWSKIPNLLTNFRSKKDIIEHNIKWVLSKHILTATILLTMMLISNFREIKDPSNPFHMLIFNGSLFVYMSIFSYNKQFRLINNQINKKKYWRSIYESFCNGVIIGTIIFSAFKVNLGIKIALIVQFIYLLLKL